MTYVLLACSYLAGATPTSYWVGRVFHGIDLREHGSGNLGATNALRILGWRSAVPVLAVDVFKGFAPVWFFPALAGGSFTWTMAFGAAAIFGHMFSLWVGFRGGKGVGTSAGVFLALAPAAVGAAFLVWIVTALTTRFVSVASMTAALALPVCVALTAHRGGDALIWFSAALAAFVIWAHRSNIRRLLRGEENRFGRRRDADEGKVSP